MQIEAHLAQQPVASTVLRPSAYVDILKRAAGQIAAGSWAGAAGEGRVLRYIVMRMALYLHFGPFSKHVINEIDRRIAELDDMPPMSATWLVP